MSYVIGVLGTSYHAVFSNSAFAVNDGLVEWID